MVRVPLHIVEEEKSTGGTPLAQQHSSE